MKVLLFLILISLGFTSTAQSKKEQIASLEQKVDSLSQVISAKNKKIKDNESNLYRSKNQNDSLKMVINNIRKDVDELNAKFESLLEDYNFKSNTSYDQHRSLIDLNNDGRIDTINLYKHGGKLILKVNSQESILTDVLVRLNEKEYNSWESEYEYFGLKDCPIVYIDEYGTNFSTYGDYTIISVHVDRENCLGNWNDCEDCRSESYSYYLEGDNLQETRGGQGEYGCLNYDELKTYNHFDKVKKYLKENPPLDNYSNYEVEFKVEFVNGEFVPIDVINIYNGCPACFTGDAKVVMADGFNRSIKDLAVGDSILTFNFEKQEYESAIIEEIISIDHNKLVELYFEDDTIRSTMDHPYYLENKGWASFDPNKTKMYYEGYNKVEKVVVGDLFHSIDNKFKKLLGYNFVDVRERTYTISKLDKGNTFIVNGVIAGVERIKDIQVNTVTNSKP